MPDPIGSVYLDQPRPTRAPPTPERRTRAAMAVPVAFIGIVGLTVAGLLVGVRSAIATPDPIVAAVQSTFQDPESRAEITRELATAIQASLLTPEVLEAAEAYGIDHQAEIDAWAASVLDDPEFGDAVGDLITDIHGRIFIAVESEPVDIGPLTDVVRSSAEEVAPSLAAFLPPGGRVIMIDASDLPDLTGPMALIDRAILIALLSGLGLPLALIVHDHRHRVLAWIGRWLLVVGLVLGAASIGLPWLAGNLTGWVTAEAAVSPSSIRLLAPAAVAGTIGIGLMSLAAVWRRREKRKITWEGAAAWLEVVEPPVMAAPQPSFDLARRGLVEGDRHLTNI